MKVQITAPAEADLSEILEHYEALRVGIGDRVLLELRRILSQIEQFPESYQLVATPLRRAQLATIPFQIYYAISGAAIPVLGIVPARLHPIRKHRLLDDRLTAWRSA